MASDQPESSDSILTAHLDGGRNTVIVPQKNGQMFSGKERVDWASYRESLLQWPLHIGKDPEAAQGDSPYTVYESGHRAAAFDRWVWDARDEYTVPPSSDDVSFSPLSSRYPP